MGELLDDLGGQRFGTIIADPPWQYQKQPGTKGAKQAARGTTDMHYGTLSNAEILALPVAELAAPEASCLLLWCTNPGMFGGRFSRITPFEIARAWGFEYRTMITWVKTRNDGEMIRNGMGWYFRGCTEHVLVCTRGKLRIPAAERIPNVIMAPRAAHSAKPPHLHDFAERVLPGPRLELFARARRPGWSSWGDQLTPEPDELETIP